jgi:hypothetical protein
VDEVNREIKKETEDTDRIISNIDTDMDELKQARERQCDLKMTATAELLQMQQEREDAEDKYINMKEELQLTNVQYTDIAEKISKVR